MKSTTILTFVTSFATLGLANPVVPLTGEGVVLSTRAESALFGSSPGTGLLGQGSNLVSNIFDVAACVVSGILGGGNPDCRAGGTAQVNTATTTTTTTNSNSNTSSQDANKFKYTFGPNPDGTLKIVITPVLSTKKPCTFNLNADGRPVGTVISDAAKSCLRSQS
ncbi:hypothetical protein G7Z17_g1739 [Cylindrodendrum hubeiense]|uniref:Uncharacterized protein n=1 Tax=Cylindrodendrum hubeiense TaxID=595255 RepID=A0A9P5HE93_9HYPO|nr:hypothetical protein G7Z17_g1739 [Cylindrodendrum hubeiense]